MTENKYEEYFIAFLDILGFKKIIESREFEDVICIFKAIINGNSKKRLFENLEDFNKTAEIEERKKAEVTRNYKDAIERANIYIMSDSIIIATPALYPESLAVVCDLCHVIQIQLLELKTPILVRGAISKGDFFIGTGVTTENQLNIEESNNTLIFGKGLVNAYLAQEKYAVVPRVIVSKNVQNENRVSLYFESGLVKDDDDEYDFLPTLDIFLTNAISSTENEIENKEIEYYEKLLENTDEYRKIKKLIRDEMSDYQDIGIRKNIFGWKRK